MRDNTPLELYSGLRDHWAGMVGRETGFPLRMLHNVHLAELLRPGGHNVRFYTLATNGREEDRVVAAHSGAIIDPCREGRRLRFRVGPLTPIDVPSSGRRAGLYGTAAAITAGTTAATSNSESSTSYMYEGLELLGAAEAALVPALDTFDVLIATNALCRLGRPGERENMRPDVLVCYNGRWAILEIDGAAYHGAASAAADHERDRRFVRHGVMVYRFSAAQCLANPYQVIRELLALMERTRAA